MKKQTLMLIAFAAIALMLVAGIVTAQKLGQQQTPQFPSSKCKFGADNPISNIMPSCPMLPVEMSKCPQRSDCYNFKLNNDLVARYDSGKISV